MTNPTYTCTTCGRVRNCMLHTRAEFPPDAAKAWLRRTCKEKANCNFKYQAGLVYNKTTRTLDEVTPND